VFVAVHRLRILSDVVTDASEEEELTS
jgi:hypothetical protein